ncbi:hypothetical protein [Streptomyces sp. DSM 118878]
MHGWEGSRTGPLAKGDEAAGSQPSVIPVGPDEASVTAAIAEQIGQARRSVDICFAQYTRRAPWSLELLGERHESVQVRLLFDRSEHEHGQNRAPEPWEELAASERVEVRIARVPLMDCVVMDGRSALLIADSAIGPQVSLARAGGVVGALHALFLAVWRGAVPVPARIDWGGHARAEFVQWVLGCLHSGMTDKQAADELSVSVRTYRRYVAEITAALGANSRFQAGLRAAELGLLPTPVPRAAPPESHPGPGTPLGPTGSFL